MADSFSITRKDVNNILCVESEVIGMYDGTSKIIVKFFKSQKIYQIYMIFL